ncbi:MAG TPA: HAMP domain-containing sensor histidine kinase [Candidatus Absconditabacterales bacterium]|nr:HAMP domain-containing sensor histidine kinase [Candidatus Absconditabacterales bacterium]
MRLEAMVFYTGSQALPLPKIPLIGLERKDPRRSFSVQTLPEDQHFMRPKEPIVKIRKINDERVLFTRIGKKLYATNVDQQIEMQIFLARTSLFLLITFSALSYFLGIYFVKSSLSGLQKLVFFVKKMDIEGLHQKISLSGPDDDEIKILGTAINTSYQKIHTQTQALRDFISHASHELKTPIMAISSTVDVMKKTQEVEPAASEIKKITSHMSDLIAKLLIVAKFEAQDHFEKIKINATQIVFDETEKIMISYQKKNISVEKNLQDELFIDAIPASLELIVSNLIDTAFKYSNEQGQIFIKLTSQSLQISNTGRGIQPENLSQIREKFRQEDASRASESYGLGLTIVKKLIDRNGWEITVSSLPEKDTSFTIFFS